MTDGAARGVRWAMGFPEPGSPTTWKGLNKPHRADRRWATAWSPEQISRRLVVDFPDDADMRISHERSTRRSTSRDAGRSSVSWSRACAQGGRCASRESAGATGRRGTSPLTSCCPSGPPRPRTARCPGIGDLMIGLNRSAIDTVVERGSRYTLLVHLPRLAGHGTVAPIKNGPALGGYGAIAMKDALTATMTTMPADLLRSRTWDRGKELSAHAQFKVDTSIAVYFADPYSPWQRGTNENTNGLLRQYFPKGTDLSRWSLEDLLAVQTAVNSRPRKVLRWRTPAEVLDEQLPSLQQAGVASTA